MRLATAVSDRNAFRRGVGLIVVLGFLALLVLLAVAFLTQAWTERRVADATLEAQRGRELVRTALAAGMNDYSRDLFGRLLLLPTPDLEIYPSAPRAAALDAGTALADDGIRLTAGEASRWLPRKYLTAAASNRVQTARWILVREHAADAHSRILGRYAYACFDMSGGIDANLVAQDPDVAGAGLPTARHNVRAVGLGELAETGNADEFKRLRAGWHGFDNLAELILLTNGKYNGGENATAITHLGRSYAYNEEADPVLADLTWKPAAPPRWRGDRVERDFQALVSTRISDLVPYSLAACRGVYDIATAGWQVPQLIGAGTDWDAALAPVRPQLADPAAAVQAIRDYLDPAPVPAGTDYPSSKNIPMFNELRLTLGTEFDAAAAKLFLDVEVAYETWYPFPSGLNAPAGSFTIPAPAIGGGSAAAGAGDIWMRVRVRPDIAVDLVPVALPAPLVFTADFNGGLPKTAGVQSYRFEVRPADPAAVLSPASVLQVGGMKMQKPIWMKRDGMPVDQMSLQVAKGFNLAAGVPEIFSCEVDDPRLNHDPSRWSLADAPNLGAVNGAAVATGYGRPGGEGRQMFCRNGPMASPAELGFISTGRPWKTIDLCTEEGAQMLARLVTATDVFQAIQTSGACYTNGTINPNTGSTNVLRAAFAKLATNEVPAPAENAGPLADDAVQALASSMIATAQSKRIAPGEAFVSGADWVRIPALRAGGMLAGLGLNENQREDLVRNTWDLFNPDNSLFTVLVIGQAIKEGPGQPGVWDKDQDMITGERRAVALVWRDPFPSASGHHHEMFVRMFKFLDE